MRCANVPPKLSTMGLNTGLTTVTAALFLLTPVEPEPFAMAWGALLAVSYAVLDSRWYARSKAFAIANYNRKDILIYVSFLFGVAAILYANLIG